MDTKNIIENEKENENEISKEKLAERLEGFINAKTGWITIPITGKMLAEGSKLESVTPKFRIN